MRTFNLYLRRFLFYSAYLKIAVKGYLKLLIVDMMGLRTVSYLLN